MNINLFSSRNRRAELLAADLERKSGEQTVYFESQDEALEERRRCERASFFFLSEDENRNLTDALALLRRSEVAEDAGIRVYVFSSSDVARTVLDSLNPVGAELFLIDPLEIMAQKLMLDHPLYEAPDRLKAEELCVTVIGGGEAIPALEKTVQWCGRMKSYIMKLNVIGPNARAFETEMKLRNPGLFTQMTQENLDMQERGLITPELYLPLKLTRTLYYQADTDSEELELALDKCLASNYIIVDEGDDEKTLRTAMFVRAHFIRKHILHENYLSGGKVNVTLLPDIYVRIRDELLSEIVPELKVEGNAADPGRDELRLVPFGSDRDVYRRENMVDPELEKLARVLFPEEFAAGSAPEESAVEFTAGSADDEGSAGDADGSAKAGSKRLPVSTRRMLCASAAHLKYKMRDMGFVEKKAEDPIYCAENYPELHEADEEEIEGKIESMKFELAALEHQRWAIFKLCDGWIPIDDNHALKYGRLLGGGIREHRQFAGKMNAACIEVSRLSGAGTKLCGNPSYFTAYDRRTGMATYQTLKEVCPEMKFVSLFNDAIEE